MTDLEKAEKILAQSHIETDNLIDDLDVSGIIPTFKEVIKDSNELLENNDD